MFKSVVKDGCVFICWRTNTSIHQLGNNTVWFSVTEVGMKCLCCAAVSETVFTAVFTEVNSLFVPGLSSGHDEIQIRGQ